MIAAGALLAAMQVASASAWLPLDLDKAPNGKPISGGVEPGIAFSPKANLAGTTVTVANVSFVVGSNLLDVASSMSGLKEIARVKTYLDGRWLGANGRHALRFPGDQFDALYLLAFSREWKDAVPRTTVRLGLFGGMSGVLHDEVVEVPSFKTGKSKQPGVLGSVPVALAGGGKGYLHAIRVPLDGSGNVREVQTMDLEFTRDMNVRVVLPDPNEFGMLPLGPPSGVVILGATLSRSPVAMTHDSAEAGNVFNEPQRPVFNVTLSNRTDRAVSGKVVAACEGPGTAEERIAGRAAWEVSKDFKLAPGKTQKIALAVAPQSRLRGWFSARLSVAVEGTVVQRRDTTFAVLAPDTRKAFDESPFGVWEFWRPHSVFYRGDQIDKLASLIKKGGWRWTYGGMPNKAGRGDGGMTTEMFKDFFEKYGFRMTVQSLPNGYQRGEGWFDAEKFAAEDAPALAAFRERGYDNAVKVLHESRSSTSLLRRFSELLGGEEYDMPAEEKAKLDKQFENVRKYCAAIKKADPKARIVLINDYPHVAIEYMKRGFPAELFDVIGLECAGFMREPERQPDWLSLLGHSEMMRRAFKKYGYEKELWTTEALYHATNPGNLSFHAQGVLSVREQLLALANGFSKMAAAGILKDPSDDYHWSNWGASGYCFRDPEINPKPSYAMMAWMTQIMDQAAFASVVETGGSSMYLLEFKRPDGGRVYPAWVVRGMQEAVLDVPEGKPVVYDIYGNRVAAPFVKGRLSLTLTDTPLYVTGATVAGVAERKPVEIPRETGKTLVDFDRAAQLKPVAGKSKVLEGNWDYPRLKGDFETAFETVDGATALKVALKPDDDARKLFQRYIEFALDKPIKLEGRPDVLNVRVKGNGGWGRVMFEMKDAKGRVWTSCGNQYAGSCNASDNKGDSFISFEGWQTLRIPVVRQYEGSDQSIMAPATPDWWPENTPEYPEAEKKHAEALAAYEAAMKEFPAKLADYEKALKDYEKRVAEMGRKAGSAPKKPVGPGKPNFRWMGVAGVDYPLTLTKVIVAMPPHILYGNGERTVADTAIWIDKLSY